MLRYILSKLLLTAVLMLVVSIISFGLIFFSGDPATKLAGEAGTAADALLISQKYGYDQPLPVQYWRWLVHAIQGDFGTSQYFDKPVSELLVQHFYVTLELGWLSILAALLFSLPLGVLAAWQQGKWLDKAILSIATIGQAMPPFCFAFLCIIVFGLVLDILPTTEFTTWRHKILPVMVLAFFTMPTMIRLLRSEMIEALQADYTRTSIAMGLPMHKIMLQYCLRNALRPLVALAAAQFGTLLAGSIVIEQIFAINGAGQLAWISISRADLPTIQAIILVLSFIYILLTLVADIFNGILDPRLRKGG